MAVTVCDQNKGCKMNHKNILKSILVVFLMSALTANAAADPARVVSKQERIPHVGSTLKTRIFLDITPDDENNRADAYVDLFNVDSIMSSQEFSEMIQIDDILEYDFNPLFIKNGRYTVIPFEELIKLNDRNIYQLFVEEFEDSYRAGIFDKSRRAYEAQRRSQSNAGR
jgi:hypothetical protein